MERVMTETEDLLAGVEADRFNNLKPGKIPNDEEYESDYADEEDAASEDEARPSPFQPVAGVQGRCERRTLGEINNYGAGINSQSSPHTSNDLSF
ncbi:hypothetical protein SNOG_15910 [Parastagonospora nodorum SN15]|uniref:Uncharacterized protein n=1 Tax=Phaeosphaeria nodorum (strain SN15 / ATCC MYA-4574 / FGSC 10173) TaxID=321614 RepID=Q0TX92_PHANO|nr:hypothetical protein SNOG_15910 [Parastagonospora nodorum SN15]EAT76748.1 hypothetical protein SNOG_15910 [Parastagonospora nodorum SN15]